MQGLPLSMFIELIPLLIMPNDRIFNALFASKHGPREDHIVLSLSSVVISLGKGEFLFPLVRYSGFTALHMTLMTHPLFVVASFNGVLKNLQEEEVPIVQSASKKSLCFMSLFHSPLSLPL